MEALNLPVPAQLIGPLWIGVQILLILLVGYFLQRGVARLSLTLPSSLSSLSASRLCGANC